MSSKKAKATKGGKATKADAAAAAAATAVADASAAAAAPVDDSNSPEAEALRAQIRAMIQLIKTEDALTGDLTERSHRLEYFFNAANSQRDNIKVTLADRLSDKANIEATNNFELSIYNSKVKNLLHEQNAAITEEFISNHNITMSDTLHQLDNSNDAIDQYRDLSSSDIDSEIAHFTFIHKLHVQQLQRIEALRIEYEYSCENMKNKHDKNMKNTRETLETLKKQQIQRLELQKTTQIQELINFNKKNYDKIKKYFSDITHTNLEVIKNLKEEVGDMKKKESAIIHECTRMNRQCTALTEPMASYQSELIELRNKLNDYRLIQRKSMIESVRCEWLEKRINHLEWLIEATKQKINLMKSVVNNLINNYQQNIININQTSQYNIYLNTKYISNLTSEIEMCECALNELLISSRIQPQSVGRIQRGLEDVLREKNTLIHLAEDEWHIQRQRLIEVKQTFENKVKEYGLPLNILPKTIPI